MPLHQLRHLTSVTLLAFVLFAAGTVVAEARPADGRTAVYRIENTESFTCHDAEFCEAIFETANTNHETVVLYSDGTGHDDWTIVCKAEIEGICPAHTTVHILDDFRWFAAPAQCDEFGCAPVLGTCVPDEFQTCDPVFWRDKPETWTIVGCRELMADFAVGCARRGTPSTTIDNPVEAFGGAYPDDTFWPATPGHYVFTSGEVFGSCFGFDFRHCPPPGTTTQIEVIRIH